MSSHLRNIEKGKFNPLLRVARKRPSQPLAGPYRIRKAESKYQPHNGFSVVYSKNSHGHIVREKVK